MKISALTAVFVAFTLAPSARAADQTPAQIADQALPSLLTIYKDVHSPSGVVHPGRETSALVAKELKAAGCEVTDNIGKYENPQAEGLRRRRA